MSFTIREWRRIKEISQETMASRLNVHVNTYQKWERDPGKISMEKAIEVAKILDVPLDSIKFAKSAEVTV